MPFTLSPRPLIGQHVVTLKRFYYHLLVCHALDIVGRVCLCGSNQNWFPQMATSQRDARLQIKTILEESSGYQVRSLRVW